MRITSTRDEGVTLGVIGRDVSVQQDLREVTFVDFNGVPHTVYAHKEGPWESPEDIMSAYYSGELHTRPRDAEPDESVANQSGSGGN